MFHGKMTPLFRLGDGFGDGLTIITTFGDEVGEVGGRISGDDWLKKKLNSFFLTIPRNRPHFTAPKNPSPNPSPAQNLNRCQPFRPRFSSQLLQPWNISKDREPCRVLKFREITRWLNSERLARNSAAS
jgi:hypothetical protein